jgi:hypothetical protein
MMLALISPATSAAIYRYCLHRGWTHVMLEFAFRWATEGIADRTFLPFDGSMLALLV